MPLTELWLRPRETYQDAVKIQIDPMAVTGRQGTFGSQLILPYALPGQEAASVPFRLLSLEGWISWSGEADTGARLLIPSQIVRYDQSWLQVPITNVQIEAIEKVRNGGPVNLVVWLGGLASAALRLIPPGMEGSSANAIRSPRVEVPETLRTPGNQSWFSVTPLQCTSQSYLSIGREYWLNVLQRLGAGTQRLVELPEPHLPRGEQHWTECMRLLDEATRFYRSGDYEQTLINCRSVVEGIPRVLCEVWGLTRQGRRFRDRIQSLRDQLAAAWREDRWTPETLRSLLAGAWHWLAPTPHYGAGIPLRGDAAFALGLCTDLLLFAGQVLQAHPHAIAREVTDLEVSDSDE